MAALCLPRASYLLQTLMLRLTRVGSPAVKTRAPFAPARTEKGNVSSPLLLTQVEGGIPAAVLLGERDHLG